MAEAKFNISQGGFNNWIVTVIIVVLFGLVSFFAKNSFDTINKQLEKMNENLQPITQHISRQEILNENFKNGIEENKDDIKELKENKKYSRVRD